MVGNRNDIDIIVLANGDVYLLQGSARQCHFKDSVIAQDFDLYFSQIPHRAVWVSNGKTQIGYPKDAPSDALRLYPAGLKAGIPYYQGNSFSR